MRVTTTFALLLSLLASACTEGLHRMGPTFTQPTITSIVPPSEIRPGSTGSFLVNFIGVTGPYTITYSFTGGVLGDEEVQHVLPTGATTDSMDVTFVDTGANDLQETLTVTIVDGAGTVATVSKSFTVPASIELRQPSITRITLFGNVEDAAQRQMIVELAGTPGLPATVSASGPQSLLIEPAGQTITFDDSGNAVAEFMVRPLPLETGSVELTVAVDGPLPVGGHDEEQVSFNLPPIWEPEDDTLYAIPLQTTVNVGEPVRIVVLTGRLPNPFQYMTGVRVCFPEESGAAIYQEMNPGAPGGDGSEMDGIWALVGATEWSMMPDSFYPPWNETGDGRMAFDFSLTPLVGGHDVLNASGALFNFEVTFDNAGTWPITFQQFHTVKRTYYNDQNQATDYYWGDISNNNPGVPNLVTVN